MNRFKNIITVLAAVFFIQTVFAEMKALTDKEMGSVSGQSGIIGTMIGFSEAYASTGGTKEDLDKAVSFNLAYANQLKDLKKNIQSFEDVYKKIEAHPPEEGWQDFEMEFTTKEEPKIPGHQIAYTDVYSSPVESGIGLFGMGGFKVEGGDVHVKMSGKIKIEFKP
ncbi:MAG: hypothetical protein JEZ12_26115 [Desulfobacterium sp.]|nr:hypothetical protein [Desulfobacterium sp.]